MRHLAPLLLLPLAGCDDYLLQLASGIDAILQLEGDPAAGEAVFAGECALCHDPNGVEEGVGPAIAPLVPALDDRELVTLMIEGRPPMPAVAIGDQEAADVLAWLRESFPGE